jgi:hypothetical protein
MAAVGHGQAIMAEQRTSSDEGDVGFPLEPAEKKANPV